MLIAVFDDAAARTANAYHSKTGAPRGAAPHQRSDGAGNGVVDWSSRNAKPRRRRHRCADVPGDSGVAWAVIALEGPAGLRASCARPLPVSEVRPATAFAVPRTSSGRSADRHRPWR